MAKKVEGGFFISDEEFTSLTKNIESLKADVEKARGESKYKLKKLSKIIERQAKKIERLEAAK